MTGFITNSSYRVVTTCPSFSVIADYRAIRKWANDQQEFHYLLSMYDNPPIWRLINCLREYFTINHVQVIDISASDTAYDADYWEFPNNEERTRFVLIMSGYT